jgi:hypothetical protein
MRVPMVITIGQRIGRLVVQENMGRRPTKKGRLHWRCLCDCGTEIVLSQNSMRRPRSCGCLQMEAARKTGLATKTHGQSGKLTRTSEYITWTDMRDRCNNPSATGYKNYGGRGIRVCARWQNSFEDFFADVGKKPFPCWTLERKDNDGNYCLENVIWCPRDINSNNRRTSYYIEFEGKKQSISQWAKQLGVWKTTLRRRIILGWSAKDILTKPVDSRHGNFTKRAKVR